MTDFKLLAKRDKLAAQLKETREHFAHLSSAAPSSFGERAKVRLCRKEARIGMKLADIQFELGETK